jgi:tetratricopeptide (TPR) repeat protein
VDWAATGAWLGLSFLTRPNIGLFALVLVAWMAMLYRGLDRKIFWRSVLGMAAACVIVIAPVTVRNAVVLHEWMISVPHGGMNFYLGNARQSTGYHMPLEGNLALNARNIADAFKGEAERSLGRKLSYAESSGFWMKKAWREIWEDPWHWQRVLATKFFLFFNAYEYTTSLNYYAIREITPFLRWPWLEFKWVAPWALLAIFWLRDRWRELLPLYGMVAVYALTHVMIMGSSEYRYAVMPFFFLLAGEGLAAFYRVVRTQAWTRLAGALLLLAVFSLLVRVEIFGKPERDYHMATAHANFGHLLVRLGDFQGAVEEYSLSRDFVRHQPEYLSGILEIIGKTYMKLQRYPEAQQVLEEAYAMAPEAPALIQELASASTANGQYDKAIALRKARIKLQPENPDAYVGLGMTCLWAHKDRDAEAAFAKALALDPAMQQDIADKRSFIKKNRQ